MSSHRTDHDLQVIAFDFDGVILESADIKTDAFVELFAEHGSSVQERVREHHLANLGISRFKKFEWIYRTLLGREISDAESKDLGEQFSALALAKILAAPFVPGAREALVALSTRFPLYVVSGTPQQELDLIVERRELRSLFRGVHGTPREKPTILRELMAAHGCGPRGILFIGDGASDHDAATAVGTRFLARDTPALTHKWVALGVERMPDLHALPHAVDRL